MTIQEVVSRFNTTPFLFAGSGVTRRYYGLPTWEDLLRHFSKQICDDRFAYNAYKSKANGDLPLTASLIQKDYDTAWYANPAIRTLDEQGLAAVEAGKTPFKMEIAALLQKKSVQIQQYTAEIDKLKKLAEKNLSGVITTNYDSFFEVVFDEYKAYVGQDNLCFSSLQGFAEIYKIHGSVTMPETIVINDTDYKAFRDKGKYLAAKLMTIFMEYPIIFIGYSLGDSNIREILENIVVCIPEDKLKTLQERFIYVDYQADMTGYEISEYALDLNGKRITMTRIALQDFGILYDALTAKVAAIPVKMLRRFKEDLYTFALTQEPGTTLKVSALESPQLSEEDLVISIGFPETGEKGYQRLLDVNGWYHNIVFDDLPASVHSYDKLLELTYPGVRREVSGYLPVCKYLALAQERYPEIEKTVPKSFDELLSPTNRKSRNSTLKYKSVLDLWNREKADLKRAIRLLPCFPEEKITVDDLESVLNELFKQVPTILSSKTLCAPSDLKRIIRIYDYLKWGQKKT